MNIAHLLEGLNGKQREAVAAPQSNLLVLAGAGSGKTRVLVHRIAYLIQGLNVSPYAVMAVTFTNKAASEMRGRVEQLMGGQLRGMWLGTFHGLAHRLLRFHHQDAGLPENFQILDSDDQLRLIKRVMRSLNLDDKKWPPRQAMGYINAKKDEGLRPKHIDPQDPVERLWHQIYEAYQSACNLAGLVDFAELLLRALELLRDNQHLRDHYQARFHHVLVDEFQDTNAIQYAWLRLLAGPQSHVMIVGDDDQSIYGWRGARVDNIHRFLDDFAPAVTIRLEQNYRSTGTILKAANGLIAHNAERLGKDLWTDGKSGEPVSVYAGFNEIDEARFVVSRIQAWVDDGGRWSDAAILYRNNAQSRVLEDALLRESIKYRIYGGLRFFERQEIKDALAYLRLMASRDDDAAFERVVNTPARGIGDRTIGIVRQQAREQGTTLWRACRQLLDAKVLSGRAGNAVSGFMTLVDNLDEQGCDEVLSRQVDIAIKESGLFAMYQAEKGEKGQARVENLEELVSATQDFEPPEGSEEMSELNAFLAHAALESGDTQADEFEDAVQMMTMHTAKGLEFPLVFVVGVEEGMFPSMQSVTDPDRLEEERRLCYVGMTRAMKKLYLCYAESRRLYGRDEYHTPSRFLREIPQECLEEVRVRTQVTRPITQYQKSSDQFNETGLNLGQRVRHSKFGDGIIINYEGTGPQSRVQVAFDEAGPKWLVVAYARLDVL
ncbi:DNA helicase II [Gallaecimonas pentaromativorans]|uniref:DNA 3'-5' helicase n=1 Tax=Gallaecimonas pentaromativorans TaxID=584787 RepID=A0A3N1P7A8_9GAMM|nr:DNA helicase II [Gallaecimonas pentaromativorans]ROQ24403.1 ATP-dependent DNA helicase UvrD [Gallaecimonas pentaromativorans]